MGLAVCKFLPRLLQHLRHGDGDAGAAHETADDGLAQVLRDPAESQQTDDGVHETCQECDLCRTQARPSTASTAVGSAAQTRQ